MQRLAAETGRTSVTSSFVARSQPAPKSGRARAVAPITRQEWRRLTGTGGFIVALHAVGWVTLVAVVAPSHHLVGTKSFGIGIGVTAYTLGMRHAFDADHIAAIDSTTRKLMDQRERPLSVGF